MLDKMAFFVYVMRLGSITSAAKKYNISISAGSRWLQELEHYYGTVLCRRSNRLLQPTEAGQTLYNEFSPLVDSAKRISKKLEDLQEGDSGHIDIACTPIYANHFLMDLIAEYSQKKPNVTFNLKVTPWALKYANTCDLMISANATFCGYHEENLLLVKKQIMQSPFIVVASPEYLKINPLPEKPTDLNNHHCLIATTLTGSNDWIFKKNNDIIVLKAPKSIEVNDSDLLLQSALKGIGVAYLPKFVVEKSILSGVLIPLLNNYETCIWSLNLYYPPPSTASITVNKFKKFFLKNK